MADLESKIEFLRSLELFNNICQSELDQLGTICFTEKFKKKSYIFFERDNGHKFYMIQEGKIKITKNDEDGNEVILAILCEGETFGEMSLIDGFLRNANAVAMEDVVLLTLSDRDFFSFLTRNASFALNLLKILTLRLRISDYAIKGLFLDDVQKRVIICLYNLAKQMGKMDGKKMVISDMPSQSDFASLAGTTRETLSRTLKKIETEGVIIKEEKSIIIPNFDKFTETYIYSEM